MTNQLDPISDEWDLLRERIIETEQRATAGTNQARDALLQQGDLFAQIAPLGQRGVSTGSGELLVQMAEECGIVPDTARHRRDFSAQMDARVHLKQLLAEASDIAISYDALRQIVLKAPEPEVFLTRKIKEAREAGRTRLRRDDVRREVGVSLLRQMQESAPEPEPEPTPQEEPEDFNIGPAWQKFLSRPKREVVDADLDVEPVARPVPAPEVPPSIENQVLAWVDRIHHFGTLLQRADQVDELRRAADYLNALADGLSAKDLTPEMFQ